MSDSNLLPIRRLLAFLRGGGGVDYIDKRPAIVICSSSHRSTSAPYSPEVWDRHEQPVR
jgi:hypothetical protein